MIGELAAIAGREHVLKGTPRPYGEDATGNTLGLRGEADAVVLPGSAEEVRRIVEWCYDHDVEMVPRGGGTGFAGGAVPLGSGVVVSLERLATVRSFEPELWRAHVDAGVSTATVSRLARENGLLFPPNPGAAEQSQIGGNLATNAGGPRAFKYGVTGRWATGLEVVVPPGELLQLGGFVRKDVAGYDLRALLVGSEGTLGIITSAWLRMVPRPEVTAPVAAFYPDIESGCEAIRLVLGVGLEPAAIEYADAGAVAASRDAFPERLDDDAVFMVLLELDGSTEQVSLQRSEAVEVLAEGAAAVFAPTEPPAAEAVARWRDGVSGAVTAVKGGKLSEDVAVPFDRLAEIVRAIPEIGARHGLEGCSWGHAGDGNVHASFLIGREDLDRDRVLAAAEEVCGLARELGGTYSGEHGTGWVKRGRLEGQLGPAGAVLHASIKRAFDPKGLLNPGKKQ